MGFNYTIKKNDTLTGIAKANNTTVSNIMSANPNITDPNRIYYGNTIVIPTGTGVPTPVTPSKGTVNGKIPVTGNIGGNNVSSGVNNDTGSNGVGDGGYVNTDPPVTESASGDSGFVPSDATNSAYDAWQGLQKPEEVDPAYWQTVMDAAKAIINREKFSYDLNGDALYQQYKDKYIQQGKMAMQDTMGQAAAMTGGYGSSYAMAAGNQAYQASLENLNDIVPELYQMAYDRYRDEGQDLLNQYSMAMDIYGTKYGEYSDALNQYNTDNAFLYGVYDNSWNRDYGQHRDAVTDQQWKKDYDQTEYWKDLEYKEAVKQTNIMQGLNPDGTKKETTVVDGDGGDEIPDYDNGGYSTSVVESAQKFVGATADGKWGSDSAAKAKAKGYNSIAEVVTAMRTANGYDGTTKGSIKGWKDFDKNTHAANVEKKGGSYYMDAVNDVAEMKKAGKKTSEILAYLQELVGNSYLTYSEYLTLAAGVRR